jgi:hypothetical protein
MEQQWHIHRDRGRCERADCPLPRSAEHYVVLELPDCTRRDLCEPCFRERQGSNPVYWKARRRAGRSEPVLDLASLRMLFDRLGEAEQAGTPAELRYLVALLLLRKRVLRMVDASTPEQEAADLVVVDPKIEGMEPVCLRAPDLGSQRLGSLKGELLAAIGQSQE